MTYEELMALATSLENEQLTSIEGHVLDADEIVLVLAKIQDLGADLRAVLKHA